jgi:acyl-CoA-dependent ceramide synthase
MGYLRWSYLINLSYIGNAVFLSMDFPDTLLAVSAWLGSRLAESS